MRIDDSEITQGSLPRKAARLVRHWTPDHRAEPMANRARGIALAPLEMIAGADLDD